MSNVTPLPTHRPTGITPWPLLLIEGSEKSGKTFGALKFSGDERIHTTWALDLGEGSLEEYGLIEGADYHVVEHDGTWRQIIARLEALVEHGQVVIDQGGVPMLVVDTGTAEWDMLKLWVDARARRQQHNIDKLRRDPDAEIKASRNLWNDADARHNTFMRLLRAFPGPVIITARGKWVSATGKDGQPIANEREYKVEAQKGLAFACNVWLRLSREHGPQVIGMRHARWGIRPGIDEPQQLEELDLGWLIFDVLGCAAGTTTTRQMAELDADQVMPDEEVPAEEQGGQRGQDQGRRGAPQPAPQLQEPQLVQLLAERVPALLAIADVDKAGTAQAWVDRQTQIRGRDVIGLLSPDDREVLGLDDREPCTLSQLAQRVCEYVGQHKRSVIHPLDAETPTTTAGNEERAAAVA